MNITNNITIVTFDVDMTSNQCGCPGCCPGEQPKFKDIAFFPNCDFWCKSCYNLLKHGKILVGIFSNSPVFWKQGFKFVFSRVDLKIYRIIKGSLQFM